mgnify:CR=1 FL=1
MPAPVRPNPMQQSEEYMGVSVMEGERNGGRAQQGERRGESVGGGASRSGAECHCIDTPFGRYIGGAVGRFILLATRAHTLSFYLFRLVSALTQLTALESLHLSTRNQLHVRGRAGGGGPEGGGSESRRGLLCFERQQAWPLITHLQKTSDSIGSVSQLSFFVPGVELPTRFRWSRLPSPWASTRSARAPTAPPGPPAAAVPARGRPNLPA